MSKSKMQNNKSEELLKNDLLSTISRRLFINSLSQAAAASALLGVTGFTNVNNSDTDALNISMKKEGGDIIFTSDNRLICRVPSTGTAVGKKALEINYDKISSKRTLRNFQLDDWGIKDQIKLLSPGFYEWQRIWTNQSSQPVKADLVMEIESAYKPEFTLVPGISYNGNPEYGRRAVKGLSSPEGQPWIFSAFRSNIPAGNYSEGGGWSIFVFNSTEPSSLYCGFSLVEHDQKLTHRLLWPERDFISGSRTPGNQQAAPPINEIIIDPKGNYKVITYFVLTPAVEKRRSFASGMDHAWRLNRRDVKPTFSPKRLWDLGIQFASESLWYDNDDPAVPFTGFCFGLSAESFDAIPGPEGYKKKLYSLSGPLTSGGATRTQHGAWCCFRITSGIGTWSR